MLKQYIKPETKEIGLQLSPIMGMSKPGNVVVPGDNYPDLAPRSNNIFAGDDEEDDDVKEEW